MSIQLGCMRFHKPTRIEYFVVIRSFPYDDSPFFAVVGFQDVLDSFVSVRQSCWVIEL